STRMVTFYFTASANTLKVPLTRPVARFLSLFSVLHLRRRWRTEKDEREKAGATERPDRQSAALRCYMCGTVVAHSRDRPGTVGGETDEPHREPHRGPGVGPQLEEPRGGHGYGDGHPRHRPRAREHRGVHRLVGARRPGDVRG